MRAPAAMTKPMIWLVAAKAWKTRGMRANSGITPPPTICSPITAATEANTALTARWVPPSSAPAGSTYMTARKGRGQEGGDGKVWAADGAVAQPGIGAEQAEQDRPHRQRGGGGDQRPAV